MGELQKYDQVADERLFKLIRPLKVKLPNLHSFYGTTTALLPIWSLKVDPDNSFTKNLDQE